MIKGYASLAAFIGSIFLANYLIVTYGLVPVGFGLMAPAGVYVVGLTFTLRDFIHEFLGKWFVLTGIVIGAIISALVSPELAIASGSAFLLSELADFAVYAPLRKKNFILAVVLSNTIGLIIDSALFLWLAFSSLDFLAGQVVGKFWMTVLAAALLLLFRRLTNE